MTRVSVICDLLYTMAVREKCRYKTGKFGWKKRKAALIKSLSAMKMLCQYTEKPELDDSVCDSIVTTVPPLCPLLLKEPEFRGDFPATFRKRWEGAEPTADLSNDLRKMLALSADIVSKSLLLLTGRRADEDETRTTVGNYLHGLHNIVRPCLPPDDRFRVSPAQGWEFARSYLEPKFKLELDPPAEEPAAGADKK